MLKVFPLGLKMNKNLAPSEQSFDICCHPASIASALVRGWPMKPSNGFGVNPIRKLYQFCPPPKNLSFVAALIETAKSTKQKRVSFTTNIFLIQWTKVNSATIVMFL